MPPSLPPDYVYFESHPAFMAREAKALHAKSERFEGVRAGEAVGIQWGYGPFRFARFTGDVEPLLQNAGKRRTILWQRVDRTDIPEGWRRAWLATANTRTGVSIVPEFTQDSPTVYRAKWNENVRRQARKWDRSGGCVRPITLSDYLAHSPASTLPQHLKATFDFQLKEKIVGHGDLVHITGAFDAQGNMLGAFGCVDIPECQASLHLSSYLLPEGARQGAGVALMDEWFSRAQRGGIRYLEFGLFHRKHEPRSWRGFSRFKAQFGTILYDYPPLLKRSVGSLFA